MQYKKESSLITGNVSGISSQLFDLYCGSEHGAGGGFLMYTEEIPYLCRQNEVDHEVRGSSALFSEQENKM